MGPNLIRGLVIRLMELVKGSATLVLLGIWNPAILNPEWLARYVFNKGDIEVPVTLEFTPFPGLPPRLTIEGIVIQPGRTRVVITLPDKLGDEELDKVEGVTAALFKELPHTPIQAVGQNFEFVETAPTEEQLRIFTSANDLPQKCDFLFDTTSQKIVASIAFEERSLNLTRTFANSRLTTSFNFHYNVTRASDAAAKTTGAHSFKENYRHALRIIRSLYGVDLTAQQIEVAHA